MANKKKTRPALGNSLELNADELEVLRKYWKLKWPDDIPEIEISDEEYKEALLSSFKDRHALEEALRMLPSRFGIEQEIRILGSILEAADYLIDAKPDTRPKQLTNELRKIEELSRMLRHRIEKFQTHPIRIAATLGKPIKRIIYYNTKYLKSLEDDARESVSLLPKSRGGRQGLLAELIGSPKHLFAEDLAHVWQEAGLKLTATQEGQFANFLRTVHQAITGLDAEAAQHPVPGLLHDEITCKAVCRLDDNQSLCS